MVNNAKLWCAIVPNPSNDNNLHPTASFMAQSEYLSVRWHTPWVVTSLSKLGHPKVILGMWDVDGACQHSHSKMKVAIRQIAHSHSQARVLASTSKSASSWWRDLMSKHSHP